MNIMSANSIYTIITLPGLSGLPAINWDTFYMQNQESKLLAHLWEPYFSYFHHFYSFCFPQIKKTQKNKTYTKKPMIKIHKYICLVFRMCQRGNI